MNMNRRKGVLPIFLFMLVFATWILWAMNAVAQTWPRPGTIGCGYYHTVGLKTDGTVVAVGWNYYGELDVDSWTGIVQVSAGYAHTVGLKANGKVVAVGWSSYGQLDVDSWTDIVQVSAGGNHTVGLKANGTVVAVGYNGDGQLDVGNWYLRLNRAPVLEPIGDQSVDEGQLLEFTVSASDPDDDDVLTYSVGDLPRGANFDAATRTFSWIPDHSQAGTYNVLFSVTDNGEPPASASEMITISVGNVNRPPVLEPIGNKSVSENNLLEFTITAYDPDGDELTYSVANLPDGASFDVSTGHFSWVPDFDQSGNYSLLFKVTDRGVPPASREETVMITVGNVNRPPVLDAIGNKTVLEGQTLTFVVTGTDPDGDRLTFSTGGLPQGATFNPATQTFTWTPNYNQAGNFWVRFTVTDNGIPQESDTEEIVITVGNVNRPPVLDAIGDKTVLEGQTLTFVVTGTDPDGDRLTFSTGELPQGATFNPATQTFTWTPTFDQAGVYPDIEFIVTDNGSPSEQDFELIQITVGNYNRAPVFTPIGAQRVAENQMLQFLVTANDPDGDDLVYSTGALPAGASFDATARSFSWIPDNTQTGTYTVVFYATDSEGLVGQLEVVITVGEGLTPCELVNQLIQAVARLNLKKSRENAYMANLKKVCKFIQNGKVFQAIIQLDAFIAKVLVDTLRRNISVATGRELIRMAVNLINIIRR